MTTYYPFELSIHLAYGFSHPSPAGIKAFIESLRTLSPAIRYPVVTRKISNITRHKLERRYIFLRLDAVLRFLTLLDALMAVMHYRSIHTAGIKSFPSNPGCPRGRNKRICRRLSSPDKIVLRYRDHTVIAIS